MITHDDQLIRMMTESLLRPDLDLTYDISLDFAVESGFYTEPQTEYCRVIAAQPTCGKTTMAKHIRAQGLNVLDTDEPIAYAEPVIFKAKKVNPSAARTFERWETALQDLARKWDIPVLCNFIPDEVLQVQGPAEIYFMRTNPGYIYRNELARHGTPRFTEAEIMKWIANAVELMGWGKYTIVLPEGTIIQDYLEMERTENNSDGCKRGLKFAYKYIERGQTRWILPSSDNRNAYPRVMWRRHTHELKNSLRLIKKEQIEQVRNKWHELGVRS